MPPSFSAMCRCQSAQCSSETHRSSARRRGVKLTFESLTETHLVDRFQSQLLTARPLHIEHVANLAPDASVIGLVPHSVQQKRVHFALVLNDFAFVVRPFSHTPPLLCAQHVVQSCAWCTTSATGREHAVGRQASTAVWHHGSLLLSLFRAVASVAAGDAIALVVCWPCDLRLLSRRSSCFGRRRAGWSAIVRF